MSLETIILYLIIAVVLLVIPAFLARKMGISPMELLFGQRVNRKDPGKKGDASVNGEGAKAAEGPAGAKGSKGAKGGGASGKREKNSSKNDMMDLISRLATYARKNHFQLIVPGTLTAENGKIAVLTAIVITRSMVVGINCFGFGGSVLAEPGESDWHQTLNGEKKAFPSPVRKNRQQREILGQVLAEAGWPDAGTEVIGVFTSPSVRLSQKAGTNCYTKNDLMTYLQKDRFLKDGGLDPKEMEKALQPKVLRARKD